MMARRTNVVTLMLMVVAAMTLDVSMAQSTHVVGGTTGWQVPSGGAATYSTWASSQTFVVGDSLVFNFPTGAHTVAEVTREGFDACNGTGPISVDATGPATLNLPTAGAHYFICTIGSHCSLGQRLSINVSAAATSSPPAAQPATPPSSTAAPVSPPTSTPAPVSPPASTPTPVPSPAQAPVSPPVATPTPAPAPSSRGPRTYIVGDSFGWNVPNSGGANTYRTWASDKTFVAGDILVFNFANQTHDVAEVTRAAFNSCNTTSTIRVISTSPARITLTGGSHYYICTFPQHCSLGQQLAINVTGSATATPPSSIDTPPTSTSSTPSAPSPDGVNGPPGSNSAPSMAALPVALLATALAFLY